MKRLLPLIALVLALPASDALADGCPTPCSRTTINPPGTTLLAVRPSGDAGEYVAYDLRTRRARFSLPPGMVSADGRVFVSARSTAREVTITRFDARTGKRLRAWTLPGKAWMLGGVSATGKRLVLTRYGRTGRPTTLALVDGSTGRVVHRRVLPGHFEVDTVSRDGLRLFLIQRFRDGERYLVRLYDVRRERLRTQALKASGETAPMAGYAWSGVASPDGRWLLTLYLDGRRNVAFVHALDLVRGHPTCIFLPSRWGYAALRKYVVALSPSGKTLYAMNATLGVVAEIDLAAHRVVRTTRFRGSPKDGVKAIWGGNAGISPDGRTLAFTSGRVVWTFDTRTRKVGGPYPARTNVAGLGFWQGRLYAIGEDERVVDMIKL